jgi:hypothetical protein
MNIIHRYQKFLHSHPLLSRMVPSFIISFSADFASQAIESYYGKKSLFSTYNLRRALNLSGYASLCVTPSMHYVFAYIAKKVPGRSLKPLLIKFCIDRTFIGPTMVFSFFVSQTLLNGGSWADVSSRLQNNFLEAAKMNFCIWSIGSLTMHKFVPLEFQVLFANCVSFFWNLYISYAVNKNKAKSET